MRIRSITSFFDPSSPLANAHVASLAKLSEKLRSVLNDQVIPVLSTRLATVPFPFYLSKLSTADQCSMVADLGKKAREEGWQYLSLGPALPDHPWSYPAIPRLLSIAEDLFCGAVIADEKCFYPAAIRASASVIRETAALTADGFANLRFAALANVHPGTPFLPAAYHKHEAPPAISIAVECADAVLAAFNGTTDIEASSGALIRQFEDLAGVISHIFIDVSAGSGIDLLGFDFSPAPFPQDWCSLGGAVEKLGLSHIGGDGSLAAVAIVANALDRGTWPRAGFNGMMLPVLEDSVLASRAEQGLLTVKDLLLYSTVCGTGLDTIPLDGTTTQEQLESILMDVAALSVRLAKPLTARLMPIPGKTAGDLTGFDFEYFASSRVMALDGQELTYPLNGDSPIFLQPRQKRN